MLELAQQLRNTNPTGKASKEITFLYPKLLLYRPTAKMQDSAELLEKTMEDVNSKRDEAESRVQEFANQVASEESKLSDDLKRAPHKNKRRHENDEQKDRDIATLKEKVVEQRLQLERAQVRFKAEDAQWKALQDSLSKSDAVSGIAPLQLIQQAEELIARFSSSETDTYLVWAEVTTAGGSYQVRRNLWRSLFWSDGLRYSGGAVVSFAFFDGNANVVLSGIHRYREPFTHFRAIWWPQNTTGNSF
jgi:hypothetical protein